MKHCRALLGTVGFAAWLMLLLFLTGALLHDGKSPQPWARQFSTWLDPGGVATQRLSPYFTALYHQ